MKLQSRIRRVGLSVARALGCRIRDARTGATIGRALMVPWRGKIHVIGLEAAVQAMWLPQKRLTYWKQEIGFATHPPVDFPNVRDEDDRRGHFEATTNLQIHRHDADATLE